MRYVEAPEEPPLTGLRSLFLAGGITGCPDWQAEMVRLLVDSSLLLVNPRRADFPIDDPSAAQEQIAWEHTQLRGADGILFWFSAATLCPIVLYELGAWSMTEKPLWVGIEPGYAREQDVRIQTALARPDVAIVETLDDLAQVVRHPGEDI